MKVILQFSVTKDEITHEYRVVKTPKYPVNKWIKSEWVVDDEMYTIQERKTDGGWVNIGYDYVYIEALVASSIFQSLFSMK